MSAKHTPGPWVHEFRRNKHGGWRDESLYVTVKAGATLIAAYPLEYAEYPASENECEANARLIAAAPELLEALKAIRDHTFVDAEGPELRAQNALNHSRAIAAIAKAEAA
jgi:hypothetical protein